MQLNQVKVAILGQAFASTPAAEELRSMVPTVRTASNNTADIIFPQGVTVAFRILAADKIVEMVGAINQFQSSFQHCVLVVWDNARNQDGNPRHCQSWQKALTRLSLGCLRFAFANSSQDIILTVLRVRESMTQPQKLALQKQYFRQQQEALAGSDTARAILTEALSRMEIPETEQELLIDAYGSIGALMLAEEGNILQNCPVSTETAERVVAFFSRAAEDCNVHEVAVGINYN